jgi:hypothetical protein
MVWESGYLRIIMRERAAKNGAILTAMGLQVAACSKSTPGLSMMREFSVVKWHYLNLFTHFCAEYIAELAR